ncbi:MAG: hypothetical protein NDP13_06575 [Crenarchaeota archaeon]|nr:hypothetical protein [Thermoproteota archaeon]
MREDYIKRLVETDDPIGEVWNILVELWDTRLPINEYFRQEDKVSEFERELSIIFFEIYDYLYNRMKGSPFRAEVPLIIVDGMSIRESNLLVRDLRDHGYEILEYSYGFSALPSTTGRFREVTGIKYVEVRGDRIPSSIDFNLPVWVSYPDEILHHAARIIPPHEAYIRTRDLLLSILRMIDRADVTITSDHGYLMIDAVWPLASGDRRFLKERVFGSSRFVKISDIEQRTLEKLRSIPRDVGYVFLDDEYCYVRGRYFWPIEGYGKVVAHGGLSLMECIVPRIRVRV